MSTTSTTGAGTLSRFEIAAKSLVQVTHHADGNFTLWVESGEVHLANSAQMLRGGPIALSNGPIVVHNPGEEPAVVFVALAQAQAQAAAAPLFSVICPQEAGNKTIATDLSAESAVDFALDHNNTRTGHHAHAQRQ